MFNLTSSTGLITSPDTTGRGLYDDSVDVLWIIEAPGGLIILFHIHFAQIRYSDKCLQDALRVGCCSLLQILSTCFFIHTFSCIFIA